ncbi:Trehalose utilization [Maioricimonas rarisocia]|uniref:Trehalose utilization n=1 Tax=Maioricimonas rarisocia TaxID=2528026 RepID=A0A517ZCC2_9PLAN|nr:PVC-type heme-binding CxxCH protein [Maioricimonas rarisocia]QDU40101.1 Trehalose utilization [Maioricimonas rarisocia]
MKKLSIRLSLALVGVCLSLLAPAAADDTTTTRQPHAVFVVGTHHYQPHETIPAFAERLEQYGFRTTVVLPAGNPEHNANGTGLPGLEVLSDADVAIFYMRFLELPAEQLAHIEKYVTAGKPVIGLRTSTHAFDYPKDDPRSKWNDGFGRDVLGSRYFIHLQGQTTVEHVTAQRGNVLLNGVPTRFVDPGTLYKTELPDDALPLLSGTGQARKTGTITNRFGTHEIEAEMTWPVAWTWSNKFGGKTFATTLGHRQSFELPALNRLLINAIHWAVDRPVDIAREKAAIARKMPNLKRPVGELDRFDPESERRSFEVLDGFEVNLWAAEPMLVNPIHMTWDPQGRLWVCCSTSYPQVQPGEKPNDQIMVLEDTDGDGRADTSTVFADGLYVPTGLELGDGGVYVANAPDLLFLKDTDGDLKADVREVVLTGFATEDNHHSISAWRWGPGGWLYFQEGTFMHTQVETPHGVVRLENGGVFQFRPRDLDLRVYADYRASNPWGHTFDRWGTEVLIDNPNLYFLAPLTANSRAKLAYQSSGRGTKQCGGEFVSGRHLPDEFQNQIWTNQYKSNTVTRYEITDDGAGIGVNELEPLIRSRDINFRPVDLKIGPDGAAYILDWYNPLIGHMQHSFRDERRDTTHGRVWRVTHRDRPLVEPPQLVDVPLDQVVSHLKAPEDWTRHQAKRVLADAAPDDVTAALESFVASLDRNDPGYAHHLTEALWAYQTIDVVNEDLLRDVLQSDHPKARAAAVRVLRYWWDRIGDSARSTEPALALLEQAVADEHPRVRLEAVLTLGFVPDARSVALACRVLDQPMDRYIEHALKLTVDGLQPHWLPAHRAGELTFASLDHRSYALSNLLTNEAVEVMVDLLNAGQVDASRLKGPAEAVARTATAAQLEKLVLTMVEYTREYGTRGKDAADPAAIRVVLEALNTAARTRGIKPTGVDKMVPRVFAVPDVDAQVAAARLVGVWKITREGRRLQQLVRAEGTDPALKLAAASALGELAGRSDRQFLARLAKSNKTADQSLGVVGLASLDLDRAAAVAAELFAAAPDAAFPPEQIVEVFIQRRGGADALGAALDKDDVHADVASRVAAHLVRIGEQHPALVEAFGGGVPAGSLEDLLMAEDRLELAADVREHGNPARGERIFRRSELACFTCHNISGAGGIIGPDLAAVGSAYQEDYLVDSILRPSKVIKEFFETAVVLTDEGRVITGILVLSDEDKIVVRDPQQGGAEVTIPTDQIDEVAKGPSLMPRGLANKLNNRQEFLDLTSFLAALGKPGPYQRNTTPILRRWRVATIDGQATVDAGLVEHVLASGTPAYSLVDGTLPAEDLPKEAASVLAVAELDVSEAGSIGLKIEPSAAVRVLVDGRPAGERIDLERGRHSLAFVIDRESLDDGLRVEVTRPGTGAATFQPITGP